MCPEDDPRAARAAIADVERCATAAGRAVTGRLVVEGVRLHERAVRAGRPPERVVVARSLADRASEREAAVLAALEEVGARLLVAPDDDVRRLMGGRGGGDLVGLVPIPPLAEPPASLVSQATNGGGPAVVLVAAGIEDPGNVGALARTALATGAAGFLVADPGDPFHPKAVRTSMGAVLKLPLARACDPRAAIDALRAAGAVAVGTVSRGGEPLPGLDWGDRPVAVVLGSEAFGLDPDVAAGLDRRVTVPMSREADSFSVNAAAAMVLYEAIVRRTCKR